KTSTPALPASPRYRRPVDWSTHAISHRSRLPGTRIAPSSLTRFAAGLLAFWPEIALTVIVEEIATVRTKSLITPAFMLDLRIKKRTSMRIREFSDRAPT